MRRACQAMVGVLLVCGCRNEVRSVCGDEPWPSPVLVFNEDNTHYFNRSAEYMTREKIRAYIDDEVALGGVTHFFMCPNGMRASFESKAFEPARCAPQDRRIDMVAAKRKAETSLIWKNSLHRCSSFQLLYERGIDIYAEWIGRCREKGVSPWFSMRMNDVHLVNDPDCLLHSRWWLAHPEFRRDPKADPAKSGWGVWAVDYAIPEVYRHQLALVEELLERYDPDGIEADWMRFPYHLTPGRERELSPVLTSFMRDVRRLADKAAKRLGHPVRVGARVAATPELSLMIGCDVEAWAREGLIDLLVVGNFGPCVDFNIPFADWRRRIGAANPSVRVIPSADDLGLLQGGCKRNMEIEDYRGWMEALAAEGADGAYLFNFFSAKPLQKSSTHDQILRNGLCNAKALEGKRRYVATYRDSAPREASREVKEYQFPATLDKVRTFRIKVGNPPAAGKVSVSLVFRDTPLSEGTPVVLNGVAAVSRKTISKPYHTSKGNVTRMIARCEFPLSALKPGINAVSVGPDRNSKTTVVACELEVEPLKK